MSVRVAMLVAAATFVSQSAAAHAPTFAAARFHRDGDRATLEVRISGSRADGLALRPVFPDDCTLGTTRVVQEGEVLVRSFELACDADGHDAPLGFVSLRNVQVHFQTEAGTVVLNAESPLVSSSPPSNVLAHYARLGVEHIAFGWDHLLFVLGLVVLVFARKRRPVRRAIGVVSAFTLGHSATLVAASLDLFQVDAGWVEAVIAASIVVLGVEITSPRSTLIKRHPAWMAGGFGLVHGLGFAGALRDVGLPAGDRLGALLGFNLGVEAGQLAFVLVLALGFALSSRLDRTAGNDASALRAEGGFHGPPRLAGYVIGIGGAAALLLRLG